jgi:hypothetical protein
LRLQSSRLKLKAPLEIIGFSRTARLYHADYAIEIAAEVFNKLGRVELTVEYGLAEGDDGATSRGRVESVEAAYPCYEVSWNAPADLESGVMTSSPERFRHY